MIRQRRRGKARMAAATALEEREKLANTANSGAAPAHEYYGFKAEMDATGQARSEMPGSATGAAAHSWSAKKPLAHPTPVPVQSPVELADPQLELRRAELEARRPDR